MNNPSVTRLAFLGTVSELHRQRLPYDLACLGKIVAEKAPDLVCAEITVDDWERGNLTAGDLEVREALAPVVASTDVVLVPVSPYDKQYMEFASKTGWRQWAASMGMKALRWGQWKAGTPQAINGLLFGAFCHAVCAVTEFAWTPEERTEWGRQNQRMVENILQVVRSNPGQRVLVVVQCQRLHRLIRLLKANPQGLELVHYQEL